MGTRSLILTEEEWRQVSIWVNNAWHDADQVRMTTRPDSPQEKAAEAEQTFIEGIRSKLAARDSVPSGR